MTVLAEVAPLGHETAGDDHARLKALLDSEFLVGAVQILLLGVPDHAAGLRGHGGGQQGSLCDLRPAHDPQRQRRTARLLHEDLDSRRWTLRRGLREAMGIATATVVRCA